MPGVIKMIIAAPLVKIYANLAPMNTAANLTTLTLFNGENVLKMQMKIPAMNGVNGNSTKTAIATMDVLEAITLITNVKLAVVVEAVS